MKHILLPAVVLTLVFAAFAARGEKRNINDAEVKATVDNVPGVTINGSRASAKPGYEFARESRNSISVIRTIRGSARLQVGTLICVPVSKNITCDAFIIGGRTKAVCRDTEGCNFEGMIGGVRAP